MEALLIVPVSFPCSLHQCPNGLVMIDGRLCIKTDSGEIFAETGERCYGGNLDHPERKTAIAQPAKIEWRKVILPGTELSDKCQHRFDPTYPDEDKIRICLRCGAVGFGSPNGPTKEKMQAK